MFSQAQAEVAELRRELQEVKDAERERQEEAIQVAVSHPDLDLNLTTNHLR